MNAKCCRNSARKTTTKRRRAHREMVEGGVGGGGSVRMRVKKLQKLIPAGHGLPPERLFRETAEYILQLRLQVDALQALCNVHYANQMVTGGVAVNTTIV